MFSRILQSILFAIVVSLSLWAQAQTRVPTQEQPGKISIVIEGQLIRFLTQQEAQEWRLEVVNGQGAVVFDSGWVYGSALEWPLKNQQEQTIPSGLYAYTLRSLTTAHETSHTQRGHLILDRASHTDRIWITSNSVVGIGAGSDAAQVTVVGGAETRLGGVELPAAAPARTTAEEREQAPGRDEPAAAVATLASGKAKLKGRETTNLAANEGLNVNGNIVFTPDFVRDITMQNNNGGLRFYGAPSLTPSPAAAAIQFWGNNSGFPGQLYLDAGATNAGALIFRTAPTGGTITERMRVSSGGNVGIGTTNPDTKLDIHGIVTSDNGVALKLFNSSAGNFNRWYLGTGGAVVAADAFSIGDTSNYKMTIQSSGNVGIGTTTPLARLDVRGNIRLGPSGQYHATSGEENLRIVRGVVSHTASIIAGTGFSVTVNPNDPTELTIYFSIPFAARPSVIVSLDDQGGAATASDIFTDGVTTSSVGVKLRTRYGCSACDPARGPFHFIAIGPR